MDRETLTLTKAWGRHAKGSTLGVLRSGEDPAPGLVDAARAEHLVALEFATTSAAPATEKPAAKATAKKRS